MARTKTAAFGLLALVLASMLGLWLLRRIIGGIVMTLQFAIIVGSLVVAAYVLHQLWSGWRRAA